MYFSCPETGTTFQQRLYCSSSNPSNVAHRDGDILGPVAVGAPSEAVWLSCCPRACFLCGASLLKNLAISLSSNLCCGSVASSPDFGFAAAFCRSFFCSCWRYLA